MRIARYRLLLAPGGRGRGGRGERRLLRPLLFKYIMIIIIITISSSSSSSSSSRGEGAEARGVSSRMV